MYETFEHTADLGLRVKADSLRELFAQAGACLFSVLVEDLSTIRPSLQRELKIEGDDLEYLLFDWLNELLYLFEGEHLLLSRFDVALEENGLRATVHGEPLDRDRHPLSHEVKAITYHALTVQQLDHGWLAEVIVDI